MRAWCIKQDRPQKTRGHGYPVNGNLEKFNIHYFILPASYQLLNTADFPSFSNVFLFSSPIPMGFFFCFVLVSCYFSLTGNSCFFLLLATLSMPAHLLAPSLPSICILDSLEAPFSPISFHRVSCDFRCHPFAGNSKFMSPDQTFLLCSRFTYSATFCCLLWDITQAL